MSTSRCVVYTLEKQGNLPQENEDAYAIEKGRLGDVRIAIADGATESSFARMWADLLVKNATQGEWSKPSFRSDVAEVCQQWSEKLQNMPLPWHAEAKSRNGDLAAMLCVYIHQPVDPQASTGKWIALSVGDCKLLHYRHSKLLATCPNMSSNAYNNRPPLLNSIYANNARTWEQLVTAYGEWQDGDEFILLTDALAAWYQYGLESKRDDLTLIHAFVSDAEYGRTRFHKFVEERRQNGTLHNDDTTLIWFQSRVANGNDTRISDGNSI